jgi:hypothetical protein
MMEGPGLPISAPPGIDPSLLGALLADKFVLEFWGNVLDLMRCTVRGVMDWPAIGEAVIIVPGAATGAGLGLFVRKRGCTSSSIVECTPALFRGLEVGLEKLGGLDGGDEKLAFGEEPGIQPTAVVASEFAALGDDGRKGPSRALAGDSGLLPGIVSRPDLVSGGEDWRVARTS